MTSFNLETGFHGKQTVKHLIIMIINYQPVETLNKGLISMVV